MGRAERRREMKKGEKMKKPPVYNYTPESLRGQLKWEANQEFQEKVKKIKAEVYDDAVNAAMMLLLTLPCQVLMEHFWQKSSSKNIPKFLDLVLDYYGRWQNGELDMGKLKKDLWEIGGIRMEEDVKGYKNQADIGLFTRDKLSRNMLGFGWGHDGSYNKNRGRDGSASETWATFCALRVCGSKEEVDMMKKVMPETWDCMNKIYHEIAVYLEEHDLEYNDFKI